MVAREWLKRGQSAKPPIDAFTDFWRGLNSLYSAYAGATEVAKIRAFLSARVSSAAAAKMLSSHPQDVTYLLSQPVIDMRGNGRDTAVAIAASTQVTIRRKSSVSCSPSFIRLGAIWSMGKSRLMLSVICGSVSVLRQWWKLLSRTAYSYSF